MESHCARSLTSCGGILGSLVRVGGNELITDDPDILFRINGARSEYRRSRWYRGARLDPKRDHLASELDEKRHTALRAKMAAGVSCLQY
jgi:hypothetical protein